MFCTALLWLLAAQTCACSVVFVRCSLLVIVGLQAISLGVLLNSSAVSFWAFGHFRQEAEFAHNQRSPSHGPSGTVTVAHCQWQGYWQDGDPGLQVAPPTVAEVASSAAMTTQAMPLAVLSLHAAFVQ
jgi:hypothetical protein